jgi:acetolactate synthase I/II/III large subunit
MNTTTAADHIAAFLEDRGVEVAYGICGHTNISLLAALGRRGTTEFITTRHEQVATHAADGYARATGRPGVAILHVGPGLTNGSTGVATAAFDSIPMLVIAGDIPSYYGGRGPHQEFNARRDADQTSVYEPFVKRAWRVPRVDQLPRILARAWDLATSGRPGPVLVSVPMDFLGEPLDAPVLPSSRSNRPGLTEGQVREIVDLLTSAERPMLLFGGGTRRPEAVAAARALVDATGITVAHTLMGTGVLPSDHPLQLGMLGFWGLPESNRRAREADVILAVGTRFPETDSSSWEEGVTFSIPPTTLLHIDIDPNEHGRNYPTAHGYTADSATALQQIVTELDARGSTPRAEDMSSFRKQRVEFLEPSRANAESVSVPLKPERILAELHAAVGFDVTLVTDVGWNKNGVAQQYPVSRPEEFLTPGGFSTMGFGPSAVLGVAQAAPERTAIALVGDGAFSSQLSVIFTAVEMGIAPIWVVMNNMAFGTIAGLQEKHYGTPYGCVFLGPDGLPYAPDYAAIARESGALGISVRQPGELSAALKEAIAARRPTVIDVLMENTPVPTPGHWDIERIYQAAQR